MQDKTERTEATGQNYRGWQSDVIVDLIKRYDFPHITLNPGASFRGLHDSLVNYGGNEPPMMLCQHEEIAVQIAHGYAKASGKPMAVILHNLVGLLHACMAIYYAYIDRVPIFIIGATGPMDEGKRRPHIDWTHSALVQGNAVRDYVKWDYQPTAIEGVPESFARAYSIMTTEPQGPVYMCYDAALQEAPLAHDVPLPPAGMVATPARMAPDPAAIAAIADKLIKAEHPLLLAEYAGRRAGGFESIVELAETAGAAVWDVNNALNFPNKHPLCLSMDKDTLRHTDLVVGLDVNDWEKQLTELNNAKRTREQLTPPSCDFVEIGFGEINISKWAFDYCRMQPCSVRALGDTALGIPELTRICKQRIAGDAKLASRIAARKRAIGKRHDEVWAQWQEEARENWDASPTTFSRLALEVWDVIKDEDWIVANGTGRDWARRIWDWRPERSYGGSGGAGLGYGLPAALGVALAHRGSGKVCVNLQADGDLLYVISGFYTAAHHRLPLLTVTFNNRTYGNDEAHQDAVAKARGRPVENKVIGIRIDDPAPDFAKIAQGFGIHAEGPIDAAEAVGPALRRALRVVKDGRPAVVDVLTRF